MSHVKVELRDGMDDEDRAKIPDLSVNWSLALRDGSARA